MTNTQPNQQSTNLIEHGMGYLIETASVMVDDNIVLDPRIRQLLEIMKKGESLTASDFVMVALVNGNYLTSAKKAEYKRFADAVEVQMLTMKRQLAEASKPLRDYE